MSLLKKGNKKKGFTLMELLIVIAIIAILAAVVAPNAFKAISKSKGSAVISDYKAAKTAVTLYFSDKPAETDLGNDFTNIKDYLDKPMSNSPFGGDYLYSVTASNGGFMVLSDVPLEVGNQISTALTGTSAGTALTADVAWVTATTADTGITTIAGTTAPGTGAKGKLALKLHN